MNHPNRFLNGRISTTSLCLILAVISSVSCKVPLGVFDLRGVDPVHQTHLGQASSLTNDESELGETNLEGIDAHRISHVPADQVESMEIPMDHHNGRVKRSKNSGYVRFGKRFSPLIEGVQGQHRLISDSNDDRMEPMYYDDMGVATDSDEEIDLRRIRAPESSYVRFGKRSPASLGYSGCVAHTLRYARNRSDLLKMLVENGCVKPKRLLHYVKKDSGFGK